MCEEECGEEEGDGEGVVRTSVMVRMGGGGVRGEHAVEGERV